VPESAEREPIVEERTPIAMSVVPDVVPDEPAPETAPAEAPSPDRDAAAAR
jgi:hypothetical protein